VEICSAVSVKKITFLLFTFILKLFFHREVFVVLMRNNVRQTQIAITVS